MCRATEARMDPKLAELNEAGSSGSSDQMDPKLDNLTKPTEPVVDPAFLTEPKLAEHEQALLDDHGREIPPWHHQVTFRALFVGAGISVLFVIMVLK